MMPGKPIIAFAIWARRGFLDGAARFVEPNDGEAWERAVIKLATEVANP